MDKKACYLSPFTKVWNPPKHRNQQNADNRKPNHLELPRLGSQSDGFVYDRIKLGEEIGADIRISA